MINIPDFQRENFLNSLREGWTRSYSANEAGLSLSMIDSLVRSDPDFRKLVEFAEQEGKDRIEDEAFRRGVVGIDKPIVYQGEVMDDTVKEYSDSVLQTLLRGKFPEKYGRSEITGAGGAPLISDISDRKLAMAVLFLFRDKIGQPIEKLIMDANANKSMDLDLEVEAL